MTPIPVGTPCYVVRSVTDPDCIGRVCEVSDHGRHAGCPHCHRGNKVVGHAKFPDGWWFHVTDWSSLKPIVPLKPMGKVYIGGKYVGEFYDLRINGKSA